MEAAGSPLRMSHLVNSPGSHTNGSGDYGGGTGDYGGGGD